ncbi:(2Fe-2S)-binding protein, partial [Mesorhizobium sp. M7D.F.Ca.US.004.03.1.1]|uniref:Rieske 2Fe-2S domain-containing protein n=1 Tax=Mesorhizobium sp. M7D.F.Ca.US.004.03.1.1 TaxID=2496702 RepID=UPI000FCA73BD
PMRLMLLGEKLIAFRDTSGRVGIFDHRCPHRCASLFFGRNEHGGIRCAYHGWKFDVEGNCLDQPNVPDKNRYPAGTKAMAYKVTERGGMVFVYMGKREVAPPLPDLEPTMVDTNDKGIALTQRDCNWLQALEGDVDTSHLGFLHVGGVDSGRLDMSDPASYTVINKDPKINVTETDFGTMYSAQRDANEGHEHHRFASFIFPFWVTYPSDMLTHNVSANAWVPIDDHHTMIFNIDVFRGTGKDTALRYNDGSVVPGLARPLEYLPRTNDWMGRWRPVANKSNDYGIDRQWQRSGESYTGIAGIPMQDQAIQESMGEIIDRTLEHLASSDRMVMLTRKVLLNAAIKYRETGELPRAVDEPELCRDARGGDIVVEKGTDWLDAYEDAMNAAIGPLHPLKAAE